jgi:hypothetical protein
MAQKKGPHMAGLFNLSRTPRADQAETLAFSSERSE